MVTWRFKGVGRGNRLQIDPRYARFRMTIGPSRIHQVGVFAAEMIPARRKVIEYTGERVNPVDRNSRRQSAGSGSAPHGVLKGSCRALCHNI